MRENRFKDWRHPNRVELLITLMAGVVVGMMSLAAVRHFDKVPEITYAPCNMCHKGPVLKTLKQYKQWHRADPEGKKRLLAELVQP